MDPDQLVTQKPFDLDLHRFQNKYISKFGMVMVNMHALTIYLLV